MCAAFTDGVASVYLRANYSAVLRLCERKSDECNDYFKIPRFRGKFQHRKTQSKYVLVKAVMLLWQHNREKHRPAKPFGEAA